MIDKLAITQVFDVLGPERVERGLVARRHTWADCFLALAYGARGELDRVVGNRLRGAARLFEPPKAIKVARLLGVPAGAIMALVDAYDHESSDFRRLAEEWLEENNVPHVRGEDRTAFPVTPSPDTEACSGAMSHLPSILR